MNLIKNIFKEHLHYFLFSLIIYFLCIVAGILISYNTKLVLHPTQMKFLATFAHNGLIGGALIVFGIITFGILNTIALAINGIVFGRTLVGIYNLYGMHPIITGIIPHAATEMLATLICCTIGYESLRFIKIVKKNSKSGVQEQLHVKGSLILLIIAFVLMGISAIIEATISHIIL